MKKKWYWIIGVVVIMVIAIILILNFLPLLPGGYCLSDKQCRDFGMGDVCLDDNPIGQCGFFLILPPSDGR